MIKFFMLDVTGSNMSIEKKNQKLFVYLNV